MYFGAKKSPRTVDAWPGYVDILSSLLMVVIFVLLIFVLTQFLLREIMSGQETEIASLSRQLAELSEMLGLAESRNEELTTQVSELSGMIGEMIDEKEELSGQVAAFSAQAEKDRLTMEEQLLTIGSLQEDIAALRQVRAELERRVGDLAAALEEKDASLGALRDRAKALEAELAGERERTLLAQREIEERKLRIQALSALVGEQAAALDQEKRLSADSRAEIALLKEQIAGLRAKLEEIGRALAAAEETKQAQEVEIKELGKRLNLALARKVHELEQYRSEFFGRLRELLGENPLIRIEGDRFVLQAELLFSSGEAELGEKGREYLGVLAANLSEVLGKIPTDIDWILRIDGHTDRVPIRTARFGSNWELSTARALSVVRFLASRGIPEKRMAATGFGEFHPVDPKDTPEAYRKNRRIEMKLTSR